jgi:prephenate dehydratase
MIIKVTSTQSKDENGTPLYYIEDTDKMPKTYVKQHLEYLKRNAAQWLLKYEIIKE